MTDDDGQDITDVPSRATTLRDVDLAAENEGLWEVDDINPVTLELHSTTDAAVWAKRFCELFPDVLDEGTMIGWFANAIEIGRNAGPSAHEHCNRDPIECTYETLIGSYNEVVAERDRLAGLLTQTVEEGEWIVVAPAVHRALLAERDRLQAVVDAVRALAQRCKDEWQPNNPPSGPDAVAFVVLLDQLDTSEAPDE